LHDSSKANRFKDRDVRNFGSSTVALVALAVLCANGAAAEDGSESFEQFHLTVPTALALGASIRIPPAAIVPTKDPERTKLEQQVGRNRGALIGTAVGTGVGLSLWMIATTRGCDGGFSQRTDLVCTKSGHAVRTTGIVLFSGGLAGMVISGTMLYVRKRQLKELGSLVARRKSRAIRWDPASAQFVF
jgi:hypothetical protein